MANDPPSGHAIAIVAAMWIGGQPFQPGDRLRASFVYCMKGGIIGSLLIACLASLYLFLDLLHAIRSMI